MIITAIDEAHKNEMGTVAHLSQNGVANFNARIAGDHWLPWLEGEGSDAQF